MRLAYTSDLHADLCTRNAELLPVLAAALRQLAPDLFVIAGDLAETVDAVESSLRVFRDVPGQRVYLAGNHDLFAETRSGRLVDSRQKFETVLPHAAARAGFHYLGLEPLRFEDVVVVGVPGFYDFTLRDPALDSVVDLHAYRAGQWRGTRAYDRGHVLWPREKLGAGLGSQPASLPGAWADDEAISESMLERLAGQLARVGDARMVVAVVHVLPFVELVRRGEFGANGFMDAYLGSARLGERLQRERRVRLLITGHQHRAVDRRIGNIRVVSRPLGDARKHAGGLQELARQQIGWLDLRASPS